VRRYPVETGFEDRSSYELQFLQDGNADDHVPTRLDSPEVIGRIRVAGIDLDGAREVEGGLVEPSLHRQRHAEQVVCIGVAGRERDGCRGV
jgi:hypothetical protein